MAVAPLREAGLPGFASASGAIVVVVFMRFFGLGSSSRAFAFSLFSAPKYSLTRVSPCDRALLKVNVAYLVLFRLCLVALGAASLWLLFVNASGAAGLGLELLECSSSKS